MNGIDAPQVGDRIRIVRMEGEPQYAGKEGTITHVDDMGQLHGTWGGCAVQPERDSVEVVQRRAEMQALAERLEGELWEAAGERIGKLRGIGFFRRTQGLSDACRASAVAAAVMKGLEGRLVLTDEDSELLLNAIVMPFARLLVETEGGRE